MAQLTTATLALFHRSGRSLEPVETDEPLESGYGPATPPGDNFCNDYTQGLAEAFSTLARARADTVVDDGDLGLVMADRGSPALFGNVVVLRRPLSDDEWQRAARRMHAFFAERVGGDFLVFSAWPTPDLLDLDFGRVGHPPLMLRLPTTVIPATVAGVEIQPVTDARGARAWEAALVDGFPEPALRPFRPGCLLPEAALAARRWRHWVAYLDGDPVGTASAWVVDRHVHVEFISTLPTARGRGIGAALTLTAACAGGAVPAMLISSDLGRPVYERLGFRSMLRFTVWAGHRHRPRPEP